MEFRLFLLAIFSYFGTAYSLVTTITPQMQLFKDIFVNYDSKVRPVVSVRDKTHVNVSFSLYSIVDVNVKEQFMELNMATKYSWFDEYLGWDPSKYDDIGSIPVPKGAIWIPDIHLFNGLEINLEDVLREYHPYLTTRQVKGKWIAHVVWEHPTKLKFFCYFNTLNFPFDTQGCAMILGSWNYAAEEIELSYINDNIVTTDAKKSEQWEWKGSYYQKNTVQEAAGVQKSMLSAIVSLQRRPLFYGVNLIFPTVVVTQASIIGFFTPGTSGIERTEKINLGMAALLAMTVMLTMVSDMMPVTSTYLPKISFYFIMVCILIFMGMCVSWFIISIERRHRFGRRPSRWTRRFLFKYVARMFCMDFPAGVPKPNEGVEEGQKPKIKDPNGAMIEEEWRFAAEVLDRFMLLLFTILHIIVTAAILCDAADDGSSIYVDGEVVGKEVPSSKIVTEIVERGTVRG